MIGGEKLAESSACNVVGFHVLLDRRSFTKSKMASLTVENILGPVADPNGNHILIYTIPCSTDMEITALDGSVCIFRYAASRSILDVRILLLVNSICKRWMPCNMHLRHWP